MKTIKIKDKRLNRDFNFETVCDFWEFVSSKKLKNKLVFYFEDDRECMFVINKTN
jgi:hypothetical protein